MQQHRRASGPLQVVALVGRPNVGKSTLFNRLTRSRDALVASVPGLTRDRHYGQARVGDRRFIVIDTGGLEPEAEGIAAHMARQTRQAVLEADAVVFVVDGREGLIPHDRTIAAELRRSGTRVLLAVNKAEGLPREQTVAEFHALGLGEPLAISSAHGDGIRDLVDELLGPEPEDLDVEDDDADAFADPGEAAALAAAAREAEAARAGGDGTESAGELDEAGGHRDEAGATDPDAPSTAAPTPARQHRIRIAVVGRPNVGKSTLINSLLGEERMIAFDSPGTTRDAVAADFERAGRKYTLVDTAGIRRRGKVHDVIEKFSVVKTLQAISDCNVAVLMLDAREQVSDQDANIAGFIVEAGRALVIAVNKWDGLSEERRDEVRAELSRKLYFLRYARMHFVSALTGQGLGALMKSVDDAHRAAFLKLSTPKLTRALQAAVERQQPPRRGMFRPKMRYAHQGGQNPPVIVIHGNGLSDVSDSYRRYLETWFRREFDLEGTPLRIEFKTSTNPYAS